MVWNEVAVVDISQKVTLLTNTFTSRLAIKSLNFSLIKPSWNWAGYCIQLLDIPGVGLTRIENKIDVSTHTPTLFIPTVYEPNYQLQFYKADWIPTLTLTIYEDSMPLNYSPDPAVVNVPNPFASQTVSITVPLSTTSVSFLALNANRKQLIVSNNSNQDLYIDLDATAAVADHTIKIPKVTAAGLIASYELESYTGVVSGIWGAAGTGAALIREMVA